MTPTPATVSSLEMETRARRGVHASTSTSARSSSIRRRHRSERRDQSGELPAARSGPGRCLRDLRLRRGARRRRSDHVRLGGLRQRGARWRRSTSTAETPLPDGLYRLFVCGSRRRGSRRQSARRQRRRHAGRRLHPLLPGADREPARPAAFRLRDRPRRLDADRGGPLDIVWDCARRATASGCPGSVRLQNLSTATTLGVLQCMPVPTGGVLSARAGEARIVAPRRVARSRVIGSRRVHRRTVSAPDDHPRDLPDRAGRRATPAGLWRRVSLRPLGAAAGAATPCGSRFQRRRAPPGDTFDVRLDNLTSSHRDLARRLRNRQHDPLERDGPMNARNGSGMQEMPTMTLTARRLRRDRVADPGRRLCGGRPGCAPTDVTQTFVLQPGWNSVFLEVRPEANDAEAVFGGLPLASAWTWNPAGPKVEFIDDPTEQMMPSPQWLGYFPRPRPESILTNLFAVQANRAYLLKIDGNQPVTWTVTGNPGSPGLTAGLPTRFNLVGFPVDPQQQPTFGQFLAPSPAHAGQPIYRLVARTVAGGHQSLRHADPLRRGLLGLLQGTVGLQRSGRDRVSTAGSRHGLRRRAATRPGSASGISPTAPASSRSPSSPARRRFPCRSARFDPTPVEIAWPALPLHLRASRCRRRGSC